MKKTNATQGRPRLAPPALAEPVAPFSSGTPVPPAEAVADYVPRIRRALGPSGLWIAAYCNQSFGYLPTAEILKQGGHESMGLTLAAGLFSPQVEETVMATVRQLAGKTAEPPSAVRGSPDPAR